ncbi:MAG: hypothetical protein D3926_12005, partial [Desulfobacteraceae bacterium]
MAASIVQNTFKKELEMLKTGRESRHDFTWVLYFSTLLLMTLLLTSSNSYAANVPVCSADYDQYYPKAASDGAGGAIIVWGDRRTDDNYDVYVQRMNAQGTVLWQSNGIFISYNSQGDGTDQSDPQIIPDGAGGAFIAWIDNRDSGYGDIYCQHINSSGASQWTANGVMVCDASSYQRDVRLVSDGSGGIILCWSDMRGSNQDIYTRRVNSSGTPQWTDDGVLICNAASSQQDPAIVSDGSGGAIMAWTDSRTGARGVYAQRINSSGAVQWTANGVALSSVGRTGQYPQICSDGAGGAVVTWYDDRTYGQVPFTSYDIFAQRINTSGVIQWTANGVAVCNYDAQQEHPRIIGDGSG